MLTVLQMSEMMNSFKNHPLLCLAAVLLAASPVRADEIRLKSGQTLTGRITYDAGDIVKIEIPISGSIKETKIIGRADILAILKDAPDDVEFNKLQTLVPTPSLVSVEDYRKMLETGPVAFLKNFPESKHVGKVKEIQATLAEELDKAERGFMKLDGEWLSPQDKLDYKELIDSKIRLLRMQANAKGNHYSQLIAAMREYEVIEENYFGSPAFPKAIELAKEVVPTLGRQLQTMATAVDYQNAEYEKAVAASTPEARVQLTAAREREDQAISQAIEADKKAGVKWVQFNPRNKQGIEESLRLAATELSRIQAFDTAALAKQAELLVETDKLIAAANIAEARTKMTEAMAIVGEKPVGDTSKSSKSKSSSKSKGGAKAGSYIAALNTKINDRIAAEQEKAKAKAAASKSEALTANLRKTEEGADSETPEEGAEKPKSGEGEAKPAEEGEMKEETAKPVIDEFAALGASKTSKSKTDEKEKGKETSKKSKSKATSDEGDDEDEAKEKKPRPAPVVEDEGMPFWVIPAGITLLAVIGIVVMKVLGLGGKKSED